MSPVCLTTPNSHTCPESSHCHLSVSIMRVSHFREKLNTVDSQEVDITKNTDVLSVLQICQESSC